jgi:hypothetical protein
MIHFVVSVETVFHLTDYPFLTIVAIMFGSTILPVFLFFHKRPPIVWIFLPIIGVYTFLLTAGCNSLAQNGINLFPFFVAFVQGLTIPPIIFSTINLIKLIPKSSMPTTRPV